MAGQRMEGQTNMISLLTEPHTIFGKLHGFPGGTAKIYNKTKGQTTNTAPRAAIIANKNLNLTALDHWCNKDCAAAIATLNGRRTVIASIYLDIRETVRPLWLDNLLHMASAKSYPVILGMDSNAHSSLFGPTNNSRGDDLEDLILQHGLAVENKGDDPTFETKRGDHIIGTHIDVTLTRDLNPGLSRWHVNREYNASDHNTISFFLQNPPKTESMIRPWSRANWQKFRECLDGSDYRIPTVMSMKKLDKLVQNLYNILEKALDSACPMNKVTDAIKTNHWATETHATMKEKVSRLYKLAKESNTTEHWNQYRRADKEFKRVCKRDKNRAWRQYKECLQTTKDTASLMKLAQRNDSHEINVLKRTDGSYTDPGRETIDMLTDTHFPAATNVKHVTYNNRKNLATEDIQNKYTAWINEQLLQRALLGFEKKKSPGPDGIKPLIFEHLTQKFISALTTVYKSAIHLAYTPKLWKQTKVIFISKPGKESYQNAKSFRPISLSNYLLKGLERLVGWEMDKALLSNPLHHKQHGFLTGKSTESAISNTTNYIEQFIMRKQHCAGVFLDISSAFDTIRPGHVRQALLKHGGHPDMVQWYHGYITHRDIHIMMHGTNSTFSTGLGFPQGGVCSAKFWLIALDYAIQVINRYNIEGNGYADDCAALYGGPRLDHALKRLQKMLDELTAWGKTCGLKFNAEKSIAVIFTRRRKQPPFALKIDGSEIPFRQEVKYLGITLDSKLYWTKHITEKISKAKRFLNHVAQITRNNWGPKPKLMRWAYTGIVRPMLCYGAMIWGHRAPEMEAKLRRVNRMAMNTFANFPKSTPSRALEIMLDVTPLHLFCLKEALATHVRLQDLLHLDWPGINTNKTHSISHLRYWENKLNEHNIDVNALDRCQPISFTKQYKINLDSFDGKKKHRTATEYNIYTDGSLINGQVGAGLSICRGRGEIASNYLRLPDKSTVFQAELTAIKQACHLFSQPGAPSPKFVKIFVDSQAAIKALNRPTTASKTVLDTANELNNLANSCRKLTIVWIPAHKGHRGNERADWLAKAGANSDDESRLVPSFKSTAAIKSEIKEAVTSEWTKEWTMSTQAAHSKTFYSGPDHNKAKRVYGLARLELGRFVRIISGHNNLNFFQEKIGLWHNPLCRFCGEGQETITHLISYCPPLTQPARELFPSPPSNDMAWSVRDLLRFSYIPRINLAFEGTWAHGDPNVDNDSNSFELSSFDLSSLGSES